MILNASWSLGETLVSGQVSPDTITLAKQSGEVKSVTVSEKLLMTVYATSRVTVQRRFLRNCANRAYSPPNAL